MESIYLLWDESHIWGLLAWRALTAMEAPFRLVKGQEIAQGLLSRKPPALLVVPGGAAKRKAEALRQQGRSAVRAYMDSGGAYLGFCGGSGLGLSDAHGLRLCPWTRAGFTNRMMHLVSGHVHVDLSTDNDLIPDDFSAAPCVPVWWPARFADDPGAGVGVLARYAEPANDFWVADLPLQTLPAQSLADWEEAYGVRVRPQSMAGQPCVVSGSRGRGRYVLSYSHLETPESPDANRWLAHLLRVLTGDAEAAPADRVPAWTLDEMGRRWDHPALNAVRDAVDETVRLGLENFLLFRRNDWLLGWRAGIPGASINHLRSMIRQLQVLEPSAEAQALLSEKGPALEQAAQTFQQATTGYLLAERLAMTLSRTLPDAVSQAKVAEQRASIFGPPMAPGGVFADMVHTLDELLWLTLAPAHVQADTALSL